MMRRRPVVVRRGPGLVGAMATTAVVAGTATAVSRGVNNKMSASQQAAQQAAAVNATTAQNEAEIEQMKSQMAAMQAQQAQAQMAAIQAQPAQAAPAQEPAAASGTSDVTAKIQQLAKLKESGVLTDEEFAAAKAKLLGI